MGHWAEFESKVGDAASKMWGERAGLIGYHMCFLVLAVSQALSMVLEHYFSVPDAAIYLVFLLPATIAFLYWRYFMSSQNQQQDEEISAACRKLEADCNDAIIVEYHSESLGLFRPADGRWLFISKSQPGMAAEKYGSLDNV